MLRVTVARENSMSTKRQGLPNENRTRLLLSLTLSVGVEKASIALLRRCNEGQKLLSD